MYVKHAIAKSNAYQCFTDLVMGQGRLPIPGEPQNIHCKALGYHPQWQGLQPTNTLSTPLPHTPSSALLS